MLVAVFLHSTAEAACPSEPGCTTNWLNVPGDFTNPVNNFSMYLLGGRFNVDVLTGNGAWLGLGGTTALSTTGNQINFTATRFDQIGPGQGTSILNASFNHVVIGSAANLLGNPTTIYIDGAATGTLVDNASSTQGHWTLNTHLFADWGANTGIDLGVMPISTNATYSYHVGGSCIGSSCSGGNDATATGSLMDYRSGLAYLVAQGVIQNDPHGLNGLRVTFGLQGQDPLAAPSSVVPLPAAAWLLGSGLVGLLGFARKRNAS